MFRDRVDAARQLAARLSSLRDENVVVLGLPRGGVPVAAVVAETLGAPLDVLLIRKLGVPFQPEVAMGAIGEGGTIVLDNLLIHELGVSDGEVQIVIEREQEELRRRLELLRHGEQPQSFAGRTALIVDDGLATGATAEAACRIARERGAARVILAVPTGPAGATDRVPSADSVYCLQPSRAFRSVGEAYEDFTPVTDEEVVLLLHDSRRRHGGEPWRRMAEITVEEVVLEIDSTRLPGILARPTDPIGYVVFAHGSGSSRFSPRNRVVADALNRAGFATLLLDLLTPSESEDRRNVFDVRLLGSRLLAASDWLRTSPDVARLPFGFFGASTGAGAAIWAAADPRSNVQAVVSRGGRPDLAGERLSLIRIPTLLVVGGSDATAIELNRDAQHRIGKGCQLLVIPRATHLFEEPGALAAVTISARSWFVLHLLHAADGTRDQARR